MDSVARTLELPVDAIVPVAVPPGLKPYNLDALWARIALEIDEAKLVQLDRLRFSEPSFRLRAAAAAERCWASDHQRTATAVRADTTAQSIHPA